MLILHEQQMHTFWSFLMQFVCVSVNIMLKIDAVSTRPS